MTRRTPPRKRALARIGGLTVAEFMLRQVGRDLRPLPPEDSALGTKPDDEK